MKKSLRLVASELLENAGVSPSYQRIMILASLLESDEHPSANALFKQLGSNVPAISRATVYNTLNLLVEKGVISSLHGAGSETRFDSVSETHGHFFCRKCKKIYDIPQQDTETKAATTQGEINFPKDYKGKWVILFSHPADFTPVCTTRVYDLR